MARRFGSILLALFLVAFAFIPGAEAWSEPVQTKQWSDRVPEPGLNLCTRLV